MTALRVPTFAYDPQKGAKALPGGRRLWRAAEWGLPIWRGWLELRPVRWNRDDPEILQVELRDAAANPDEKNSGVSGDLFARCPLLPEESPIEETKDSSRYFVLHIRRADNFSVPLGVGFVSHADAKAFAEAVGLHKRRRVERNADLWSIPSTNAAGAPE